MRLIPPSKVIVEVEEGSRHIEGPEAEAIEGHQATMGDLHSMVVTVEHFPGTAMPITFPSKLVEDIRSLNILNSDMISKRQTYSTTDQ